MSASELKQPVPHGLHLKEVALNLDHVNNASEVLAPVPSSNNKDVGLLPHLVNSVDALLPIDQNQNRLRRSKINSNSPQYTPMFQILKREVINRLPFSICLVVMIEISSYSAMLVKNSIVSLRATTKRSISSKVL